MAAIKMIKTIIFTPDLDTGGAERVTLNIIEQLDKAVFDVYLIIGKKNGDLINDLPNNIKIINLNVSKTLYAIVPLYLQCRKIKPQLFFSSLNRGNILLICISKLLRYSKVIIREPNMPSNQSKILPKTTMACVKYLYPKADYLIAQTEDMRTEMIEHYKIDPHKIKTIINPINTRLINILIHKSESPYPQGTISIVTVGSLIKRKALDYLIKSFWQCVSSHDNLHLYILGKGSERDSLKYLIDKHNLTKKIHLIGFQGNPYPYLKFANIFVLSSRMEGLPNVVLEALYLQTKVVVTDCVPYISKLVVKGGYGYVAKIDDIEDLGEKINLALQDNTKQPKLTFNNHAFDDFFKEVIQDVQLQTTN